KIPRWRGGRKSRATTRSLSLSASARPRVYPLPALRSRCCRIGVDQAVRSALEYWHSGQNTAELPQRLTHLDTPLRHSEFADRALVRTTAFLDDRNGLAYFTLRFEVTHHDHRVGEITDIDGRRHVV